MDRAGGLPLQRRQLLAGGIGGLAIARTARAGTPPPITTTWPTDKRVVVDAGTNIAAAPSTDGKRVAIDLGGIIWTLPMAGGQARPITPALLDASQPDWRPDSDKLLFQAFHGRNFHIWQVDTRSGALQQLTQGAADCREPAVSPDGRQVAFVSDAGGRCRVMVRDLESGAQTHWHDFGGEAAQPAWSADGREIICIVNQTEVRVAPRGGPVRTLAQVPTPRTPLDRSELAGPGFAPDGTPHWVEIRQGTARLVGLAGAGSLSPDIFPFRARWLADGSCILTAAGGIHRHHPAGHQTRAIAFTATLPVATNSPRTPGPAPRAGAPMLDAPAMSADGRALAFRARNAIWLMENGGAPRKIIADGFCTLDPAWAPDGATLAVASDRGGTSDLWLWTRASGAYRQLSHHDGAVSGPAWAPDGRRLAFIDHRGGLFLCDAGTGAVRQLLPPQFLPGKPSWSADGRYIALAALVPASGRFREGHNQLLFVDVESGATRFQPLPGGRSIATRGSDGPHWAPDGRALAMVVGARLWLWEMDADGKLAAAPRPLNAEVTDCPRWSGDGQSLIYLSGRQLRRIGRSGGTPATIAVPLAPASPRAPRPLLLRAGAWWDGEAAELRPAADIRIDGATITAIRPPGTLPQNDAQLIDASRWTAMPGLVDSHVHVQMQGAGLGDREGRLWLSYGITAVRSLAGPAHQTAEYRDAIASGDRVGPRVFATGEALDGARVYYNIMRPLTEPGQLALEIDRAQALGYDWLKCYVRLPADDMAAAVAAAHRAGIPAASHYLYPSAYIGMDSLEHMGATSRLGYSRKVSQTGRVHADVEAVLRATGMAHIPTLFQAGALYRADPGIIADPRLTTLLPPWQLQRLRALVGAIDDATAAGWLQILEHNVRHIQRMLASGGRIVSGTDAPLDFPAISLHMNLRGMVHFGVSPAAALQTATRNAGQLLNARLGVIAAGALADIALVEGNPLADIRAAANTRLVIASGIAHDVRALRAPFARA